MPVAASRAERRPALLVPTFTVLVLALLTVLPLHIPGYAAVTPAFVLMGVYHWTIYRPELLPPVVIFVVGVVLDLLCGAPLGVSPLVLLVGHASVLRQRRHFVGRLFPFVWAGFALLAVGAIAASWGIGSLFYGVFLDPRLAALRAALTVAAFPAASWLLGRAQRAFLGA